MRRVVLVIFLTLLISFFTFSQRIKLSQGTLVSKYLAIIVLGSDEFVNASERCYDLISNQWSCAEGSYDILYLSSNLSITPNADKIANKTNFHWALTGWLKNNSNQDAQVWICIFSHGLGLYHHSPLFYGDGEWWWLKGDITAAEVNSDERSEITEAFIWWDSDGDGWRDTIGLDVNGDDVISNETWVGVDESITLKPMGENEIIRDDEFKQWLDGVNYRRMVIYMGTCRSPVASENDTASCYGGGFIDDLSAPRRIIITCTNETYSGWYNSTTGVGWFEEPFMDALDPESPAWDEASNLIDEDYVPSVLEAFIYAHSHDMARKAVRVQNGIDPWQGLYVNWREIDESPWLDDGGNFKPSFINGEDVGVSIYGYDSGDGWLARYTWLAKERYSSCVEDVNDDYKVDLTDVFMAAQNFGRFFPGNWNSECSLVDLNEDDNIDLSDYLAIAIKFGWTA